MIPASKNALLRTWFRGYVRRYLRRSFHRVLLLGDPPETPEGPLLVCLNHSSWWDLLICHWLSEELLGWDSYGPMDERQLRRYPVLRRLGAFGVDRESLEGARAFLRYSRALLAGRRRALWITAQGAMLSTSVRPIRLYSGMVRLARDLEQCSVTTLALDYEFWDDRLPEAFVSFSPVRRLTAVELRDPRRLQAELARRLETQMDELAAVRTRRDPSLFRVGLSSAQGISPAYDLIRRCA
ncbi:MAG: lysophospholipid acyltransferase family protein, partial [Actinomycetota bacterium]